MKLTKTQREELKQKYDGYCAYCGDPLGEKWHAESIVADELEQALNGGGDE